MSVICALPGLQSGATLADAQLSLKLVRTSAGSRHRRANYWVPRMCPTRAWQTTREQIEGINDRIALTLAAVPRVPVGFDFAIGVPGKISVID